MIYIKCLIKDHQLTLNDSSDRCDSSKNYHFVVYWMEIEWIKGSVLFLVNKRGVRDS